MNHELAFMLGFAPHAKHGLGIRAILEKGMTDVAPIELLSSRKHPVEESFITLFIWISLSIRQLEILLHLSYNYVPIQIKAFDKLIPNIQSEFGEEILFRSSDLLYVFHFCPKNI